MSDTANDGISEHHFDDREPLAYGYEGDELICILYEEKAVRECEQSHWIDVTRTPAGTNRTTEGEK